MLLKVGSNLAVDHSFFVLALTHSHSIQPSINIFSISLHLEPINKLYTTNVSYKENETKFYFITIKKIHVNNFSTPTKVDIFQE